MPLSDKPRAANTRLIAGAMSGTSADGVDVAIVSIAGQGIGMDAELVRHHHVAYDSGLRDRIFELRASQAGAMSGWRRSGATSH